MAPIYAAREACAATRGRAMACNIFFHFSRFQRRYLKILDD
jgi:hypothetical protein